MTIQDPQGKPYLNAIDTAKRIYADEGAKRFFAGVGPRTMWITIGGFVFFGAYGTASEVFSAM